MSEWLVQLSGHKFDLEELPKLFSSPDLEVVEDKGKYYLKSSEFNSLTDASKVRTKAKKSLEFINGAMKIKSSDFQPVSIGGIERTEDDRPRTQYILPESIRERSKVSGNLSVVKAGPREEEETTKRVITPESWVMLAKQDKNVAKVLRFFSKELTWDNLYKIWEAMEEDQGNKIFLKGWASEKKIERFTRTANSYLAIGDKARHAHEKNLPPKKPMKLSEAESLIRTIVNSWISEK